MFLEFLFGAFSVQYTVKIANVLFLFQVLISRNLQELTKFNVYMSAIVSQFFRRNDQTKSLADGLRLAATSSAKKSCGLICEVGSKRVSNFFSNRQVNFVSAKAFNASSFSCGSNEFTYKLTKLSKSFVSEEFFI